MSRMAVFAQWIFFLFISANLVFLAYFFMLRAEQPPLLDLPGRVAKTTIKAGDDLVIHNKFDRPIKCASWWHRYIYDDGGMQILGLSEYRPAGAPQTYNRTIRIPDHTRLGRASYQSTIFWQCNWVQQVWPKEIDLPSIELNIVE
jgi:hypothetical protein